MNKLLMASGLLVMSLGVYAGNFVIVSKPAANVVVNSTVTGKLITTKGHLSSIESTTVNGVTTFTITVGP